MSENTRLEIAVKQIEFARQYTGTLIEEIGDDEWFRQPGEGITHVAWQVGHLAIAEYGLGMFRMRGRQEGDAELLPSRFRRLFGKGTTPNPDPAQHPSPTEIRGVFDRIHQQVLQELPQHTETDLDEPCEEPYALFATKLGALFFCSAHEMMHAGQLGLLRRLLGKTPIR
ncbi:MAG: DinB family protein [Pirellulaceae bacterium]